jgi:hypothetical protein
MRPEPVYSQPVPYRETSHRPYEPEPSRAPNQSYEPKGQSSTIAKGVPLSLRLSQQLYEEEQKSQPEQRVHGYIG